MVSSYEKLRLERIQQNQEYLKQLGIESIKKDHEKIQEEKLKKRREVKRKREEERQKVPPRRSLRVKGSEPEIDPLRPLQETTTSLKIKTDPSSGIGRFSSDPIPLHSLDENDELVEKLMQSQIENFKPSTLSKSTGKKQLSKESTMPNLILKEENVVKVLKHSVYSMDFHQSSEHLLVAAGGKSGIVGLWAPPSSTSKQNLTDEGIVCSYEPFTRTVSSVMFDPFHPHHLLAASHDGTIRRLNFEHSNQGFEYVHGIDETNSQSKSYEVNINGLEMDRFQAHVLYICCNDGRIEVVDTRISSKSPTQKMILHTKRINTVSQHPLNQHEFVTASNDQTVCIWDLRQFSSRRKANSSTLRKKANLQTIPFKRSINSAAFSPNGRYLLTVSMDDRITLLSRQTKDKTLMKESLVIPHDNQTGRWVHKFQGNWDPKHEQRFVIGSRRHPRGIEIFHANQKEPVQIYTDELFQSIHSINRFHPTLNCLVSGNSSGRLCLWTMNESNK